MIGGTYGKILHVDLTSGDIRVEQPSDALPYAGNGNGSNWRCAFDLQQTSGAQIGEACLFVIVALLRYTCQEPSPFWLLSGGEWLVFLDMLHLSRLSRKSRVIPNLGVLVSEVEGHAPAAQ